MRKLKLLLVVAMTLLTALGGGGKISAQSWTNGSEVAVGDYYLYNIAAKRFLTAGSS